MTRFTPQFQQYIRRAAQYMANKLASNDATAPLSTGDRKQAIRILEYALHEPDTWAEGKTLLLTMAPVMERAGYRNEWMPYLQKGIRQGQHIPDEEAIAALNFHLGVLQELVGDYPQARSTLQTSAALYEKLGKTSERGRSLNRLARVAQRQRQHQEASTLATQALDLLPKNDAERGYSYQMLGAVALDKCEWVTAAELFEQAYQCWQADNNKLMMARTLSNLGIAQRRLKQYDKAIATYEQVIVVLTELHDPINQAVTQMNLGNTYLDLEQPEAALPLLEAAEIVFRQSQEYLRLGKVNNNIGLAHSQLQQWDSALEAFTRSLDYFERIGNNSSVVNVLDGIGMVYLEQGNYQMALKTFENALTRLGTIQDDANYAHLLMVVTSHKQQATDSR